MRKRQAPGIKATARERRSAQVSGELRSVEWSVWYAALLPPRHVRDHPTWGALLGWEPLSGGKFCIPVQMCCILAPVNLCHRRWLNGFILQMRGFHSGPSRAKVGKQLDARRRDVYEVNSFRDGRGPRDPGTKSHGAGSGIAKSRRHRNREKRGPDGRDSVRDGTRAGDAKRGP